MNTPSPDEPLREDGWTHSEFDAYSACRDFLRDKRGQRPVAEAEALVPALRSVWQRNHCSDTRQLRKSGLLTRGLALLSREELYPPDDGGTWLLEPRLHLCLDILLDSPQRPVLDACALFCLEQELEERWSERFPMLAEMTFVIALREPARVLPLLVLLLQLDVDKGRVELNRLRSASYQDKRLRLVELVGILEAHPDERALEALVQATYVPIFAGLGSVDRGRMVGRLFRELTSQQSLTRNDRFKLVLDPILANNPRNPSILAHLFELMLPHGERIGTSSALTQVPAS